MKIEKILKLLLTALYVVIDLRRLIRRRKKQRNTKKFETIVIGQVSIEGVLIAFVISTFVIDILKYQYFFITWRIMMDI